MDEWASSAESEESAMTKIICDAALREKLHDFAKPLELCDESGHVLARVVPVPDPAVYESSEPQISKEEWDRRMASRGKTRTTAEVLAYLETL
jgi:hypothetical protein